LKQKEANLAPEQRDLFSRLSQTEECEVCKGEGKIVDKTEALNPTDAIGAPPASPTSDETLMEEPMWTSAKSNDASAIVAKLKTNLSDLDKTTRRERKGRFGDNGKSWTEFFKIFIDLVAEINKCKIEIVTRTKALKKATVALKKVKKTKIQKAKMKQHRKEFFNKAEFMSCPQKCKLSPDDMKKKMCHKCKEKGLTCKLKPVCDMDSKQTLEDVSKVICAEWENKNKELLEKVTADPRPEEDSPRDETPDDLVDFEALLRIAAAPTPKTAQDWLKHVGDVLKKREKHGMKFSSDRKIQYFATANKLWKQKYGTSNPVTDLSSLEREFVNECFPSERTETHTNTAFEVGSALPDAIRGDTVKVATRRRLAHTRHSAQMDSTSSASGHRGDK